MNQLFAFILPLLLLMGVETALDRSWADGHNPIPAADNDPWHALMQRKPYPYTIPIPADIPTAVDGVYVKFETKETPPIPCRRCPDYKPEGGWWKVSLHNGIFRIYHPASGWKSLGTYAITGDRIQLANDPVCPEMTGDYRWEMNQGNILLSTVQDKCSAGLRAKNFTHLPWRSCHPPSNGAAVGDHWTQPEGCAQR